MERDGLGLAVDISTLVVGTATVLALIISATTLRSEGKRHRASLEDERLRHEEAWRQQIALDHHARIYEATAELITAVSSFTRSARTRLAARIRGEQERGYFDELEEPGFAEMLDRAAPISALIQHLDASLTARHRLYFLISSEGVGEKLLDDLIVIQHILEAARPVAGYDAGKGDFVSTLDSFRLRDEVSMTIEVGTLEATLQMDRLRFVDGLVNTYFVGRIGRFVPAPPIVELGE